MKATAFYMPLRERGLKANLFAKFWLPKTNGPLARFVSLVLIELLKCSLSFLMRATKSVRIHLFKNLLFSCPFYEAYEYYLANGF